ncbi:glycerate kinase [Cryobacterium tagatosivorans]|uniref:Glycerate kinase n=1 Tax=Cryobacterium tagatosivorans TaxID=1259199 RepID=A0A4R8UAJ7_9MICO|nr:glycerate kinase [Cryobacterium tagatosivorans]TFB46975.1 glycerate kinase [Cryobacterium tagatosivorans]
MRIVLAPDKFKGSLGAPDVAAFLEAGLHSVDPDLVVDRVPVADGGEGTLDAAVGSGFTRQVATVTGPTGLPLQAAYAVRGREAVIELATASGLAALPGGVTDALRATSRGTGELIAAALARGCTHIIVGIGGSAGTDGGAGLLSGLGAGMLGDTGTVLPDGGGSLTGLAKVDLTGLDPRLAAARITLASDVDNPLLGPTGAAAVFAPQKGAGPGEVELLESALRNFARVLAAEIGAVALTATEAPGSGAAGGVGYAVLAVLGGERRAGIDVVLEFSGLHTRVDGADLVITGEGCLDHQSLGGKAPVGVARAAARAGVPTIAVCGQTTLTPDQLSDAGFDQTYALTDLEPDTARCMSEPGALLTRIGALIATRLGYDG